MPREIRITTEVMAPTVTGRATKQCSKAGCDNEASYVKKRTHVKRCRVCMEQAGYPNNYKLMYDKSDERRLDPTQKTLREVLTLLGFSCIVVAGKFVLTRAWRTGSKNILMKETYTCETAKDIWSMLRLHEMIL